MWLTTLSALMGIFVGAAFSRFALTSAQFDSWGVLPVLGAIQLGLWILTVGIRLDVLAANRRGGTK